MQHNILHFFSLTLLCSAGIFASFQPAIAMPAPKPIELSKQTAIGNLGQPLGKVTTISGEVSQEALGAKSTKFDLVLLIKTVDNKPLAKPVSIPFDLFPTAKVTKPFLGQSFTYVGYETGGFTGVPAEAFKWVPAIATTNYHFASVYQVLHEVLPQVKTKVDLNKSLDRRAEIIGKYVVTSTRKPNPGNGNIGDPMPGIPGFQGTYKTVAIELSDGTKVPLYSPALKQSNRPSSEVEAFEGKMVNIVGKLANAPTSAASNAENIITIVSIDQIEIYRVQK